MKERFSCEGSRSFFVREAEFGIGGVSVEVGVVVTMPDSSERSSSE